MAPLVHWVGRPLAVPEMTVPVTSRLIISRPVTSRLIGPLLAMTLAFAMGNTQGDAPTLVIPRPITIPITATRCLHVIFHGVIDTGSMLYCG